MFGVVSQLIVVAIFLHSTTAEVTVKDLEQQLGLDLSNASKVSWKDWVNLVGGTPPIPSNYGLCNTSLEAVYYACCDFYKWYWAPENLTSEIERKKCRTDRYFRCSDYVCDCFAGRIVDGNGNCILPKNKELGERCDSKTDSCYAAFGRCIKGICRCAEGFHQYNDTCKPNQYYCPFEKPYSVHGKIPVCQKNTPKSCPPNYSCMADHDPVNWDLRPVRNTTFLTSGHELGYCCPMVPRVFEGFGPFCLRGDVISRVDGGKVTNYVNGDCPLDTHYYDVFSYTACCPRPCISDDAIVINGKCTY